MKAVEFPHDAEEVAWEQLAATEMGQGFADGDAIYDRLSGRRPRPGAVENREKKKNQPGSRHAGRCPEMGEATW